MRSLSGVSATTATIDQLYRTRAESFRRAVIPIVGPADAADVVQEAFRRAIAGRRGFRGGLLEAWVWQIVKRCAFDRARAAGADALPSATIDDIASEHIPEDIDPELAAAIRALSPRRRLVVFLRYYADLSYPAIADLAGIREGTVAATLAAAHAELRSALAQEVQA